MEVKRFLLLSSSIFFFSRLNFPYSSCIRWDREVLKLQCPTLGRFRATVQTMHRSQLQLLLDGRGANVLVMEVEKLL